MNCWTFFEFVCIIVTPGLCFYLWQDKVKKVKVRNETSTAPAIYRFEAKRKRWCLWISILRKCLWSPISCTMHEVDWIFHLDFSLWIFHCGFFFCFCNAARETMLGILHTIRQGVCTYLWKIIFWLWNKVLSLMFCSS